MSNAGDHKGRPYESMEFKGLGICSMRATVPAGVEPDFGFVGA